MPYKFLKLLVFILLSAVAAGFLFYLNPTPVTFKYWNKPEDFIERPLAFILLLSFFAGVILTTISAFWGFAKYKIYIWQLHKSAQEISTANKLLSMAREDLALNNLNTARNTLQKIIDKDPRNIAAHIMLARTYQLENNFTLSLKILDEARSSNERNKELLLFAAELNESLENHTASIDNLVLALEVDPKSQTILRKLISNCQKLNKQEQALEFGKKLVKLADNYEEQQLLLEELAQLELNALKLKFSTTPAQLQTSINDLLKKHRNFAPALFELAIIEKHNFNFEAAISNLTKAFSLSPQIKYLEEICFILLGINQPDRTIALISNLLLNLEKSEGANSTPFINAKIFFISLLIYVEHIQKAQTELNNLLKSEATDQGIKEQINLLQAILEKKQGNEEKANQLLVKICREKMNLPSFKLSTHSKEEQSYFHDWSSKAKDVINLRQQPTPEILTN